MKRNKLKTGILFGVIALSGLAATNAQSNRERQQKLPTFKELLKSMDANEDGKLSKEEVKGPLKDDFDKIYTNEDGFITKEELDKAPKPERKGNPKGE